MEAWFLFYVASDPVRFRVAIGIEVDDTKPTAECYVMGIFNSAVGFKALTPNTTKGATQPEEKGYNAQVPLPAHGSYFWAGFSFPQDNECWFYLNEASLESMTNFLMTSNIHQMALPKDDNDCRLMEMHFICPAGTERNFFPVGEKVWLCSPPATSFSSGGNVLVTGHFEVTDSTNKRIKFDFDDDTNHEDTVYIDLFINHSVPGTQQFAFAVQGNGLMCRVDDEWSRFGWVREGWKQMSMAVERNFRVEKLEVSTGANIWKAA